MTDLLSLTRELCAFRTGVVADANEALFARIAGELPLTLHRWRSGDSYNGWLVPDNWRVERALLKKNGKTVFDASAHALGVAYLSQSFHGRLDWDELQPHLVTNPQLPEAYMFHCQWQYRPWAADWALSVPYRIWETLGPGEYEVDLRTVSEPGEMIVAECELAGSLDKTIVFHSNNCHPHMANDGFAGTAVMIRLFQWLAGQATRYTYRLVVGPEHIGTIFYLRDMAPNELNRLVAGVFGEMMGTGGPFKVASSFLGDQPIDRAFRNVAKHYAARPDFVPWRMSAGNDETVWEAPGYEVPFVQVNREERRSYPFAEYHSSLDTPELMQQEQLEEFLEVFKRVIFVLENNSVIRRKFKGLICLSNPQYQLYKERIDPAVKKDLPLDSEKWGYLQDCLLRYFDGSMTVLDIAEKHDLPFDRVFDYLLMFQEKDLVDLIFTPIQRVPISN